MEEKGIRNLECQLHCHNCVALHWVIICVVQYTGPREFCPSPCVSLLGLEGGFACQILKLSFFGFRAVPFWFPCPQALVAGRGRQSYKSHKTYMNSFILLPGPIVEELAINVCRSALSVLSTASDQLFSRGSWSCQNAPAL